MDQNIFPNHKARCHLDDAPFADERDRYLRHCAEHGATLGSLTIKRNELLWIAARLKPNAHEGVGIEVLQRIGKERQRLHGAVTAVRRGYWAAMATISWLVARADDPVSVPGPTQSVRRMDAR
jgi:integrase/recombinase XerD